MKFLALLTLVATPTINARDEGSECQGEMWVPHCTDKPPVATLLKVRDESGPMLPPLSTQAVTETWTAVTQEDTTTIVPPMVPSDRPFPSFPSSMLLGAPSDAPDPHVTPPMVPSNRSFPNPTASSGLTVEPRGEQDPPTSISFTYTCSLGYTTDYRGRCFATRTTDESESVTTTPKIPIDTLDHPPSTSASSTYTCSSGFTTDYRGHCTATSTAGDSSAYTTTMIPIDSFSTDTTWVATIQTLDVLARDYRGSVHVLPHATHIYDRDADPGVSIHNPLAQHTPPSCMGPVCSTTLRTSVRPTSAASVFKRANPCSKCTGIYYTCRSKCTAGDYGCLTKCCETAKSQASCCGCLEGCVGLGC